MKKNVKIVIVIAITVLSFVNFSFNKIIKDNSSLTLDQIECYQTISSEGTGNLTHVTYCTDCKPHLARSWSNKNACIP